MAKFEKKDERYLLKLMENNEFLLLTKNKTVLECSVPLGVDLVTQYLRNLYQSRIIDGKYLKYMITEIMSKEENN